jgi:hypothetical protein
LVSKKKETLPPVVTKPKIVEKKIKEVKDVKEAVVKKKKYKTPEYHLMGLEEQGKHRARFKAQFFLLKDTWGNAIPEINDQMSLVEIHELYEMYIKNIHIKSTTGKYKVYMVIMWLGIEFICIKIGLNVSGYTMSQFKSMNKYERLLLELGEKNYSSSLLNDNNDWPVEVNIIFMALVNAVVFIIIKVLAEYIGEGFANTITEMMSTYLSGADPNPGNILFGGQPSNDLKSPPGNHSQASEHVGKFWIHVFKYTTKETSYTIFW